MRSLSALLPLTALALGSFGCGIISKDLEGEVRFEFSVDDEDAEYVDIVDFDPSSNPDVKENRDKVEAGSVVEIALEIIEVQNGNGARIVAGQADVKRKDAPDTEYIQAVGQWAGIPLYNCDPTMPQCEVPAIGQVFKLDLPADTQNELSDIVFRETDPLTFALRGYAFDDYLRPQGPVKIRGEVVVKMKFTVSAP